MATRGGGALCGRGGGVPYLVSGEVPLLSHKEGDHPPSCSKREESPALWQGRWTQPLFRGGSPPPCNEEGSTTVWQEGRPPSFWEREGSVKPCMLICSGLWSKLHISALLTVRCCSLLLCHLSSWEAFGFLSIYLIVIE